MAGSGYPFPANRGDLRTAKAAAKETAMGKGGAPQGASGIYENKRNQAAEYGLSKWHHTGSHDRLDL